MDDAVARLLKWMIKVGVLEVRSRWDELDLMKVYGINKVTAKALRGAIAAEMSGEKGSVLDAKTH